MTKHVFTNDMVAHVWAQGQADDAWGRNHNNSFRFEGRKLLRGSGWGSDRHANLVTARLIDTADGPIVLHVGYLAKHQRASFRVATRHLMKIQVAVLGAKDADTLTAEEHAENLKQMVDSAEYHCRRDAVYHNYEGNLRQACETYETAIKYARLFSVPSEIDLDGARTDIQVALDAWNTPEAVAERERVRLENRTFEDKRREHTAAMMRLAQVHKVAAWRAGEHSTHYFLPWHDRAMLRVSRGGPSGARRLQTSQGAEVPLLHAINIFQHVTFLLRQGGFVGWAAQNQSGLGVGSFKVTEIDPNGTITAGCHVIEYPEMERAAVVAGVLSVDDEMISDETRVFMAATPLWPLMTKESA